MSEIFPEKNLLFAPPPPASVWTDERIEMARQYSRAREYCGFSLDELINSRPAQRHLKDIWLVGCMVRKPAKAFSMRPGNPFRSRQLARR